MTELFHKRCIFFPPLSFFPFLSASLLSLEKEFYRERKACRNIQSSIGAGSSTFSRQRVLLLCSLSMPPSQGEGGYMASSFLQIESRETRETGENFPQR